MAGSLTRATIVGNVGRDPEVRAFQDGGRLANLSVATSLRWRDKRSGDVQEKTEWHRVVIKSDALVGVVEKFVRKGSRVLLEGRLETRKWQDQSGADRYSTEIVVSGYDGRLILLGDPSGAGAGGGSQGGGSPAGSASGGGAGLDDLDDQIPF